MKVIVNSASSNVIVLEDEDGVTYSFSKDWLETAYIAWMYETTMKAVHTLMRDMHKLTMVGASEYARTAKQLYIRGINL